MEGIYNVEETYKSVREIQLNNLVSEQKKSVVLFTMDTTEAGLGIRVQPDKVLLSVVDMEDDSQHNAIIVNEHVLISTQNFFVLSEDDNDGAMCIGGLLLVNTNDHPYEEVKVNENNTN